ncbi:MAG: hypothetical protein ACUVSK_09640 [Desulfotomaculales bacterium]
MSRQKYTLDVKIGPRKYRRYEFSSAEDRAQWERLYKKSRLFMPYFLAGVVINILLYLGGLDLSKNLVLGALVGLGVPLTTMYLFSEIHFRLAGKRAKKKENEGRI